MALDEIRVLGPVEAVVDGKVVAIGGRNGRAVVATLVLGLNHAVSTDHLAFGVWGDEPPVSAHGTLQTYVSRLRHLLGHTVIEFEDDAYRLIVDEDKVDAVQFERLAVCAEQLVESDPGAAKSLCMEAMGLWRGEAFGDLGDDELFRIEVRRLEEMRLAVMEMRLEADIELDNHVQAAGLLEGAVADHPYRERLWYLLMLALARDGRRVEALAAFRRLADLLAENGLVPSQDIKDLEQEILVEGPGSRAHLAGARAMR